MILSYFVTVLLRIFHTKVWIGGQMAQLNITLPKQPSYEYIKCQSSVMKMKRRRQVESFQQEDAIQEEGRKQLHGDQPTGLMAGFDDVSTVTFEMRNIFLENAGSFQSTLKAIRQFFNRKDVNRLNILRDLSQEACERILQLMETHELPEAKALLKIVGRLDLSCACLEQLFKSKHLHALREQFLELVCINIQKSGYVDKEQINRRCRLCRSLILEHLLPGFTFNDKEDEYCIALLGYYLFHTQDRKSIVEECKAGFLAYLTSQRKLIASFFQQLLRLPELKPTLTKFVSDVVDSRYLLQEDFEVYLCANLISVMEALQLNLKPQTVLPFLCLKIKSLSRNIRKAALESLMSYPDLQPQTIRLMIVKDTLDRTVNHCRGIFLQLLEDEYHQIRILTIKCLKSFSLYLDRSELKEIMFYMINDNNQNVRIEALQALISIAHDYIITADDLNTMLMCLKDRRIQFRYYVYRLVGIITVVRQKDLLEFVDRLIKTLKVFKEDKVYLYTALKSLGSRSKHLIVGNVKQLLEISDLEDPAEPNWRNILYKAKIILIANCFEGNYEQGIRDNAAKLPPYFLKHFQYVRDVEPYAFDRLLNREEALSSIKEFNLTTPHNKIQFLRSHIAMWERVRSEQDEQALTGLQLEEQYLRRIFQLGCLLYELDGLSLSCPLGEIRLDGLLKKILTESIRLDCFYRCESFRRFLNFTKLNCLLATLLAQLSSTRLNKSRLSEIVVAIAKFTRQAKSKLTDLLFRQLVDRLQASVRNLMKDLEAGNIRVRERELQEYLKKGSAFDILFQTLLSLKKVEVQSTALKLSIIAGGTNAEQLSLRVEIPQYTGDIEHFYIRVERKNRPEEYIQVVDGQRIDSLKDTHRAMFIVDIPSSKSVKRVTGIKRIATTVQEDIDSELLELFKVADRQAVEMSEIKLS